MKKLLFALLVIAGMIGCKTTQQWIYVKEGTITTKYNETIHFNSAEVYRTYYHTEVNLYGIKYIIINKDIEYISLDLVYIKQ